MADFSLGGGAPIVSDNFTLATTLGTLVTAAGAANTVGAWTEIVSASNNTDNTDWIEVFLRENGANVSYLVNIAIGAVASEVEIISNIWVFQSIFRGAHRIKIPCKIPAGVRISANCQSNIASETINLLVNRGVKNFESYGGLSVVDTYGANTATTDGTTVARSTAGTWGAWVEMTSSLTDSIKGFVVSSHRPDLVSWSSGRIVYEVGVGGSGNEISIAGNIQIEITGSETAWNSISSFMAVNIAAGERVSIRATANVTNSDFDFDYVLYGVR